MSSTPPADTSTESHWFEDRDVDVLVYRVNRRPVGGDPSLFEPPGDVLVHLVQTLRAVRAPVQSGRRYQREWRVGNLEVGDSTLTGMLGWSRTGETLGQVWDEESSAWADQVLSNETSAVAPFAFSSEGRYLGVLRHPTFEPRTVQTVLKDLLARGERTTGLPTVDWDVEPVGDESTFTSWLGTVDSVTNLRFVFKRPNPDGEESFLALFERLDSLEAERITEEIAARDPQRGLDKQAIQNDTVVQGFLAAAMIAFGYVVGRGVRDGRRAKYDQRDNGLRLNLSDLTGDWATVTRRVRTAVQGYSNRKGRGQ